jgi:hypothetical protein
MLQDFDDKDRVEGVPMAKHHRKVGGGFARCAGTSSFFSGTTRELQQGCHICRSLRVVCNLTRARI